MFLQKLEIQGFKSFADKVVLEFNHDLTAIVGPNGSGKSNIADSVRWVLGEQSLKLLRGKKSEDVIFSGSNKRSRLGYAEVSLYLNNQDGSAPIDYREVVITRRIYRSGESEYLINKTKVRLTDIQLLLAKCNFGQKTYSIIGQGTIDSVLISSPEERKEFFDEATGIRQYQIKKDQAINKLDRSQENLKQSQQVLQEIEPRLRSLTRQVKRLERKEEIARTLNEMQTKYYSRLLNDLSQDESKLREKLAGLESQQQKTEDEQRQVQKQLEQIQIQDTEAQAFQKLQKNYSDSHQQKNQLLKELALIKGKLELELTKQGKIDLVWARTKKDEIEAKISQLTGQISEINSSLERRQNQLAEKTAEQHQIISQYQNLQEQLIKEQKSLASGDQLTYSKIQTYLAGLYQKQQEFMDILEKIKDLDDLGKLKRRAEEISKEISWLLNKLDNSQQSESADLVKIQEKINQFLTSKDSLVNEIQELAIGLEVAKQKASHFKEEQEKLEQEKRKIELELGEANFGGSLNQALVSQQSDIEKKIKDLDGRLDNLQQKLDSFSQDQEQSKNRLFALQRQLRDFHIVQSAQNNEKSEITIGLAKIETKKEDLEKEIATEMAKDFNPQRGKIEINLGETFAEIGRLKSQLAVIGGIDEEVIKEYKEVKEKYDFLNEQCLDLERAIDSCRQIIEELDEKIKIQFEEAFEKINQQFSHYFKILFNGGTAKLILQKKRNQGRRTAGGVNQRRSAS